VSFRALLWGVIVLTMVFMPPEIGLVCQARVDAGLAHLPG
jgi:hypothetical protein